MATSAIELENQEFERWEDPGHSWLKVPITHVRQLGCKISGYSYFDGRDLYLEEDLDMTTFVEAWMKFTGKKWQDFHQNRVFRSARNMPYEIPDDILWVRA